MCLKSDINFGTSLGLYYDFNHVYKISTPLLSGYYSLFIISLLNFTELNATFVTKFCDFCYN